jgi:hypothetical protein
VSRLLDRLLESLFGLTYPSDAELGHELLKAIRLGSVREVERLLEQGASAEFRCQKDVSFTRQCLRLLVF